MKTKSLITILILLVVIFLVWGFIGGSQAKNIGVDCNFGIGNGETFCWNWQKNIIGKAQDALSDLGSAVGNAVKDLDFN